MTLQLVFGSWLGGAVLLGFGLLLALGGLGLIWYSARMTREAVSRRVDLVRDKGAALRARAATVEVSFVRGTTHGRSAPEHREAVRLFAAIGVPAAQAMQALVVAQLVAIGIFALGGYLGAGRYAAFSTSPPLHLAVAAAVGIIGWFVPQMLVRRQIKRRAKAVVDGLPDALELLVICVEAGLSFEDGLDRIVGELVTSMPALAEELALTSADLKILPSRDMALGNFATRIPMPSVQSVVTTLSQTMRYGTPLAHALRGVASELRNDSLVKLEERANQLPTLMTIPMMIFIMPTIFMIVGGPAVLRLLDAFGP